MNEMTTLDSLEKIIKVGLESRTNWFRGHSETYGSLMPKVFREEYYSYWHRAFSSTNIEAHILEEFKRVSPSITDNLPGKSENLDWLILMQHYGVPTRLLDWSESILVAAFFIVEDKHDVDGELWKLMPEKLNEKTFKKSGFPLINNNNVLNYLVSEPLHVDPPRLAQELEIQSPVLPIAFRPRLSFDRITAQSGAFTIHPFPTEANYITTILKDSKHLTKYIIPKNAKPYILGDLEALGINNRSLFSTLDYLSKDLCRKYQNILWNN